MVFSIRLYYIFTTTVIVKEVKQYATKSTSYDAIDGSNNLRNKRGYQYIKCQFIVSYSRLVIGDS